MKKSLLIIVALMTFLVAVSVVSAGPSEPVPFVAIYTELATEVGPFMRMQKGSRLKAVYYFKKDSKNKSTCFGACAVTWPPVIIENNEMMNSFNQIADDADAGWKKADFGLINRGGKKQVTFRGFPLYFYSQDKIPGGATEPSQGILGHKKNNLWFLINPKNFPAR